MMYRQLYTIVKYMLNGHEISYELAQKTALCDDFFINVFFHRFIDVGFPVGTSEGINQLVMQIHYKNAIPCKYMYASNFKKSLKYRRMEI